MILVGLDGGRFRDGWKSRASRLRPTSPLETARDFAISLPAVATETYSSPNLYRRIVVRSMNAPYRPEAGSGGRSYRGPAPAGGVRRSAPRQSSPAARTPHRRAPITSATSTARGSRWRTARAGLPDVTSNGSGTERVPAALVPGPLPSSCGQWSRVGKVSAGAGFQGLRRPIFGPKPAATTAGRAGGPTALDRHRAW